MLPCQENCSAFCSGCHKNCAHWKLFQEQQRIEREAKKRYLQYHLNRCAQATHQFLAMQARRAAW